jgi:hypothetical protein
VNTNVHVFPIFLWPGESGQVKETGHRGDADWQTASRPANRLPAHFGQTNAKVSTARPVFGGPSAASGFITPMTASSSLDNTRGHAASTSATIITYTSQPPRLQFASEHIMQIVQ